MVRAILSGRKTVTRRLVSDKVPKGYEFDGYSPNGVRCSRTCGDTGEKLLPCPYGESGDRLWVKETFQPFWVDSEICPENRWKDGPEGYRINYVADSGPEPYEHEDDLRLTPSIYMPRWASRILLEVVSVCVERLHEITEEDAKREGVDQTNGHQIRGALIGNGPSHREGFAQTWEDINGKRASWASNPWVFRVEFRKVRQ